MVADKFVFIFSACAFIGGACLGYYYGVKYREDDDIYDDYDEFEDFDDSNFTSDSDDPSPLDSKEYWQLANDLRYSEWVENREHPQEEDIIEDVKHYIITEEKFSEEKFEYEKKCVTYYRESEDLIDDLTGERLDISFTIGKDVMKYILEELADYNFVVYSRNDATSVDYEITMNGGSYNDGSGENE